MPFDKILKTIEGGHRRGIPHKSWRDNSERWTDQSQSLMLRIADDMNHLGHDYGCVCRNTPNNARTSKVFYTCVPKLGDVIYACMNLQLLENTSVGCGPSLSLHPDCLIDFVTFLSVCAAASDIRIDSTDYDFCSKQKTSRSSSQSQWLHLANSFLANLFAILTGTTFRIESCFILIKLTKIHIKSCADAGKNHSWRTASVDQCCTEQYFNVVFFPRLVNFSSFI